MDNWKLKESSDLNRMLKVRTDLESIKKEEYPHLIILTHRYATSDDVLFPEPSTLGFFAGFEERCLANLTAGVYVAQDIHTGLLDIHIYTNDYKTTITETVEYLKQKPEYHIEFKVNGDKNWNIFKNLGNES